MEITIKPHESFEGKYKWRVRGVGVTQRAGVADCCISAMEAAKQVKPTLELVK